MKQLSLAILLATLFACSSETPGQSNLNTDWDTYLGNPGRTHYSELTQITRENVGQLELAWKYDSGELREGSSSMYTTH